MKKESEFHSNMNIHSRNSYKKPAVTDRNMRDRYELAKMPIKSG